MNNITPLVEIGFYADVRRGSAVCEGSPFVKSSGISDIRAPQMGDRMDRICNICYIVLKLIAICRIVSSRLNTIEKSINFLS